MERVLVPTFGPSRGLRWLAGSRCHASGSKRRWELLHSYHELTKACHVWNIANNHNIFNRRNNEMRPGSSDSHQRGSRVPELWHTLCLWRGQRRSSSVGGTFIDIGLLVLMDKRCIHFVRWHDNQSIVSSFKMFKWGSILILQGTICVMFLS